MPIAFLPPLPPADGWSGHKKDVKRCRGTVCYGALTAHFGTDSPKELEWRVDGRRPYRGEGDESTSNKYRRWRQGKALPHDDTVSHVLTRSGGGVRLDFWRDLALWELLAPVPPPMQRIHRLLEGSPMPIRRILFQDGLPDQSGRFHHSMLNREQQQAIRNQHSLGAFIALLCLARKGESLEDDPAHYLPAACAFDIFPRVLYTHRPLRYHWEGLFDCLDRIFWRRVYAGGILHRFPIETVQSSLQALDADPSATLPRMSGKRFRVIETDPLRHIEERMARAVSVT